MPATEIRAESAFETLFRVDTRQVRPEEYQVRKLKALLFDVDGTLADTGRDGRRVAFNQAFADASPVLVGQGGPYDPARRLHGGLDFDGCFDLAALRRLHGGQ